MSAAKPTRSRLIPMLVAAAVLLIAVPVAMMFDVPARLGLVNSPTGPSQPAADDEPDDGRDAHSGHNHGGSTVDAIELSQQARENLKLRVQRVSLGSFTEYVEVPGVVASWPGRTHIVVTSPLTGVINAINISRGELIKSGTPLFSLRLTHQDLVKSQEQFLTQLG